MSVIAALPQYQDGRRAEHAHTGAWVAGVLRAQIASGDLKPGSRLSEQPLAGALRVSRNTLREAFTTLIGESIVKRIPNRGVFVVAPGTPEVREIYNVRRQIEPGAVLWGRVSDDALSRIEAIVEAGVAARARGDIRCMADANQALHRAVIALTDSRMLEQLMDRVLAQMRLIFHAMTDIPDFHSHYVARNVALAERLRSGERQRAAEQMRAYLNDAEAELLGHMQEHARP